MSATALYRASLEANVSGETAEKADLKAGLAELRAELKTDIAELGAAIGKMATKEDLAALEIKMIRLSGALLSPG